MSVKPMRILQIVSTIGRGSGVMQVIYNWHKNIDRTKVQFDYLCFLQSKAPMQEEIQSLGGKVYYISWKGILHLFSFLKQIFYFFKTHKYNIVHSHVTQMSFFYFPILKFCGIKNIIQHSHNTKWSDKLLNGLRNRFLFFWIRPFISKKLACSDLAGKFLFKKNYTVINNGIDTEKFKFNQEIRDKNRKELNIENKFVISNIGRFELQKNYQFLIEIFDEVYKKDKSSILLLVGDGSLKKEIEQKVENLKLQDNVLFLGVRSDIENIYQAVDILVMPSFYEGLPVVGVEAQASGIPCIFADTITKDVLICNSKQLSLNSSTKQWANEILKYKNFVRKDESKRIKEKDFDIKETTKKIQNIYLQLSDNNNG